MHDLFFLLSEDAFMGFLIFDRQTLECLYLNKKGRELLELNEARSQLDIRRMFVESARVEFKPFNEALVAHEGLYEDVMLKRTNGQMVIANVGVKHQTIDQRTLLVLMIQDVTLQKKLQRDVVAKQTEIKSAYEELLKQNRRLRELDLAKNRFIALTTHELRTPLSAMVASAEILHLGLYDNPEQMKEFVDMIYQQGQHLHQLVDDILDFAKIQAGRMDFFVQQSDASSFAEKIVEHFQSMAEAAHLKLTFSAMQEPALCYFDDLRLRQVLSNIMTNAVKYNVPNGQIHVWLENHGDHFRILVKDTGKGIAKEQIEKVFDEFETLGQVALHHKGTGLGMPISRRLMEGMGGQLLVESEIDKGSTFWVQIPTEKTLSEDFYRPRPGGSGDLAA